MRLKIYFDVFTNKIKSLFVRKIAYSATIFNSVVSKKAAIKQNTRFYNCEIKDYSYIGRNCLVQNTNIGKFVSVADNCNIGTPSHPINYVSTSPVFLSSKNVLKKNFANLAFEDHKSTQIGNDVWIGSNVLIKSGLTVGDGAVIGMGSIVTHDIPSYEIWAGNPARLIRKRFDDRTIEKLLEIRWWDWDDKKIARYAHCFDCPQDLFKEIEK